MKPRVVLRSALAAIVLAVSLAPPASRAADPLVDDGCRPLAEANRLVAAQGGKVVLRLDGNALDDRYALGTLPRRHSLVQYTADGVTRFAIFRQDQPLEQNPSRACPWLVSTGDAALFANPQPGRAAVLPAARATDRLAVTRRCVDFRASLRRVRDAQLSLFGGRYLSGLDVERISDGLASPADRATRARERAQESARVDREGDADCDTLERVTRRWTARSAHKLVLLMPAREHDRAGKPMAATPTVALFVHDATMFPGEPIEPLALRWMLYVVQDDGMAVRMAMGYDMTIHADASRP